VIESIEDDGAGKLTVDVISSDFMLLEVGMYEDHPRLLGL